MAKRTEQAKGRPRVRPWMIVVPLLLAAVLFLPLPTGMIKDGGTREYRALTYKIVSWHAIAGNGKLEKTCVYWLPRNFSSYETLRDEEMSALPRLRCTVLSVGGDTVTVQRPDGGDELTFDTVALGTIGVSPGDTVDVFYTGTADAPTVLRWVQVTDLRDRKYPGTWIETADPSPAGDYSAVSAVIERIYADCFIVRPDNDVRLQIKYNGTLPEDLCVGDRVLCMADEVRTDSAHDRVEAVLTAVHGEERPDDLTFAKPVIYLYPPQKTDVRVRLSPDGQLTCTYPRYDAQRGWQVTAAPDGTLTDAAGQTYRYLYWEGEAEAAFDFSRGFCVRGADTAAFLEQALDRLGLTRAEANEFIIYWLPQMQDNAYNIIAFQQDAYTDAARLSIDPAPDTLIRVFMAWQASDRFVDLPPQELNAPARTGFTVVEWGGGACTKLGASARF